LLFLRPRETAEGREKKEKLQSVEFSIPPRVQS